MKAGVVGAGVKEQGLDNKIVGSAHTDSTKRQ